VFFKLLKIQILEHTYLRLLAWPFPFPGGRHPWHPGTQAAVSASAERITIPGLLQGGQRAPTAAAVSGNSLSDALLGSPLWLRE